VRVAVALDHRRKRLFRALNQVTLSWGLLAFKPTPADDAAPQKWLERSVSADLRKPQFSGLVCNL